MGGRVGNNSLALENCLPNAGVKSIHIPLPSTWVIFSRYKLRAGDTALLCIMPWIKSLILQKAVCEPGSYHSTWSYLSWVPWDGTQDLTHAKLSTLLRTTASLRLFPYKKTKGSFQGFNCSGSPQEHQLASHPQYLLATQIQTPPVPSPASTIIVIGSPLFRHQHYETFPVHPVRGETFFTAVLVYSYHQHICWLFPQNINSRGQGYDRQPLLTPT